VYWKTATTVSCQFHRHVEEPGLAFEGVPVRLAMKHLLLARVRDVALVVSDETVVSTTTRKHGETLLFLCQILHGMVREADGVIRAFVRRVLHRFFRTPSNENRGVLDKLLSFLRRRSRQHRCRYCRRRLGGSWCRRRADAPRILLRSEGLSRDCIFNILEAAMLGL